MPGDSDSNGDDQNQDIFYLPDEKEENAIYQVYLKKVFNRSKSESHNGETEPGHSIAFLIQSLHKQTFEDEASFSSNESHSLGDESHSSSATGYMLWHKIKVKAVKAASLEKIVESCINEDGTRNYKAIDVLLATFRTFTGSKELLTAILDRYYKVRPATLDIPEETRQESLRTLDDLLHQWLKEYPDDFREPPVYPTLSKLIPFCERFLRGSPIYDAANQLYRTFLAEEDNNSSSDDLENSIDARLEDVNLMFDDMSDYSESWVFLTIPTDIFAQQLTAKDAALFRKVIPHQCLGSVWSKRDERTKQEVASVRRTVEQFNFVSLRVIATIVKDPDLTTSDRAKNISKWIDIAQECHKLRNFSSVKAIVSGLQAEPVHRLSLVWEQVDKDRIAVFDELSSLFSEENNHVKSRELHLLQEGVSSSPDSNMNYETHQNKKVKHRSRKKPYHMDSSAFVYGIVPFLGTYLFDLTMIDNAYPDLVEHQGKKLFNFEKKRKEYDILSQIKTLQAAAARYQFDLDTKFWSGFQSLRVYNDSESYDLSCEIEPAASGHTLTHTKHRKIPSFATLFNNFGLTRRESNDSARSDQSNSEDACSSVSSSVPNTPFLQQKLKLERSISQSNSCSSFESAMSLRQNVVTSMNGLHSENSLVVKVSVEDSHSSNVYKSIAILNSDRTQRVIRTILEKFYMDDKKPEDYLIFQVLPDRELQIIDNCNVFYAIDRSVPALELVLRRRDSLSRSKRKKKS